jgi:hypothetical protein
MLLAGSTGGEPLAERARQEFREGLSVRSDPVLAKEHFRVAVELLEELHEQGVHNAALYRTQGNAALLAGDLPRAILAYRRGLRHSPADAGLQEGLAAAREEVARKVASGFGRPPVEDRPPWLPRVGFSGWSFALCLAVWTFGFLSLARWRMFRQPGPLLAGVVALVLAVLTATLLGLATLYEQRDRALPLVVIAQDELPLRLGNGLSYPSQYPEKLPRGAEARLLHRRGEWLQIELTGGAVGWVPLSAVLLD